MKPAQIIHRHSAAYARTWVLCLVVLALTSCGHAGEPWTTANDEDAGVVATHSSDDPLTLEDRARMWWERVTDTSGTVTGRITYADGRPVARTMFECVPDVPRPRPDIAILTHDDGTYRCRGAPGSYTLIVFRRAASGFIVEQKLELIARTTTKLNIIAADPVPAPTPTWTKPG